MISSGIGNCFVRHERLPSEHIRLLLKDAELKFACSQRQMPIIIAICRWLGFPQGYASKRKIKSIRLRFDQEMIVMKIGGSFILPSRHEIFARWVKSGRVEFWRIGVYR